MKKLLLNPPANIGIIGGGQLGRMMSPYAKRLGYHVTILDPTVNSPAMQVSDKGIVASFSDESSLRQLGKECDVISYEFEHIDADLLMKLESDGDRVIPSGRILKIIQDKFEQKTLLKAAGLPVPDFYKVNSEEDIIACIDKLGLPLILKSTKGGYDGKGNYVIKDRAEVSKAIEELKTKDLMIEEFVNFTKELSIVVAKDFDEYRFFPIVENIHEDSILRVTKAPALVNDAVKAKIEQIGKGVVETLNDVGIFCIEVFLTADGDVYINEIAPRPHNSAHYTIEGCVTSQYEQLVRILAGLPMGSTEMAYPAVAMVNVLGNEEVVGEYTIEGLDEILKEDLVYVHMYGKKATAKLKKIGHITVCGTDADEVEKKALRALDKLKIKPLNK